MATPAYVTTLLGPLEAGTKRVLVAIFEYVLGNLRLGQPVARTRSENLQAYYYEATTPAVAGTEFAITHGLGRAPYLLVPVVPVQGVGAQLVPLTVTRAADATCVYLSSTATNAPITVLVEG